jgi:predicted TIM-barrel fold metal-dependent hydrolase
MSSCATGRFYTEQDFAAVKKIDAHFHIRNTTTEIAEQAIADNFQVMNVSVGHSDSSLREQERYTLQQVADHPNQVYYITAFSVENWDDPRWADQTINQLKEAFGNGAIGIKIWKNIGMADRDSTGKLIMIDDPGFDPVIRYVTEQGKTVLGHLGEPRNCWLPLEQMTVNYDRNYFRNHPEYHMYLHPDYPGYEEQLAARDRFLLRHPGMRFVGAHLASLEYNVDSLAKTLDRFPGMAVDMAARICHLQHQTKTDREKVRNFMIRYQDRILYGTDFVTREGNSPEATKASLHDQWMEDWKYFSTDETMSVEEVTGEFRGLRLPKEVIDKIYYSNALRWFKIKNP